jgi:signal transduction histidine kinase
MLRQQGYRVRPAPNGEIALAAAERELPDLILLDITMPGLDGYAVCQRLKKNERLCDVPVIFISALDEVVDKVKAFAVGGVDYVTKPFQFEVVQARVATHLYLHKQARQLRENFQQLRELEAMQETLVQMIVHDMRSPLTIIKGFLELACMHPMSEPSTTSIMRARRATVTLVKLVDTLLDVHRMESGQLELQSTRCDLSALIRDVAEQAESLRKRRTITLHLPPTPIHATCDRDLIFRVLQNLVTNAINFTEDQTGLIVLSAMSVTDHVEVEVVDNGIGIAEDQFEHIFDKFGQVSNIERRTASSGIGLTFCKLAIEAHGGRITVASAPNEGSRFSFTIPVGG